MKLPKLPPIRVGLLNVNWTNGSRVKPCNPIPDEILADFEVLENYKINWINDDVGTIRLKGVYNYLVYDNSQFYFLENTHIVDIDKSVFVYGLAKDQWQTFLNNPNHTIKGHLKKTSNERILWGLIQNTKGAIADVNSQKVLHVCEEAKCDIDNFWVGLDVKYFKRDENGKINQFGYDWRFNKTWYDAFIEKLNRTYNSDTEPNQIISYAKLQQKSKWENYIAELIEAFLKKNLSDLTIGTATDLDTVGGGLNTKILNYYTAKKQVYILSLHDQADKTIVSFTRDKTLSLNELDLSQITKIRLIDVLNLGKEKEVISKELHNKSILDFPNKSDIDKSVENDSTKWYLKTKMYGRNINYNTFKHLPIADEIFEQNYHLNMQQLIKLNLWVNPTYDKHHLKFSNSLVPAFYYPYWQDSIPNNTMVQTKAQPYNTEVGYLLNNISNYHKTVYKNKPNRHVYNGENVFITTGIKLNPDCDTCKIYLNLSDDSETHSEKKVNFSEVYREYLTESFWLTMWNVYLWWGEMDRFFVGLGGEELGSEIKYTEWACWVDDDDNVWDSEQLGKTDNKKYENKLPTPKINVVSTTEQQSYLDALETLQKRRFEVEIKEEVTNKTFKEGDIYWNPLAFGLFPRKDDRYEAKNELIINEPCVVIYTDKRYDVTVDNKIYESTNTDFAYKAGFLFKHTHEHQSKDIDNLIINKSKSTDICYIRPLLQKVPLITSSKELKEKNIRDLFATLYEVNRDLYWGQRFRIGNDNWYYNWPLETGYSIANDWPKNNQGEYLMILAMSQSLRDRIDMHLENHRYVELQVKPGSAVAKWQWVTDIMNKHLKKYIHSNYIEASKDVIKDGYKTWIKLSDVVKDIKSNGATLPTLVSDTYKTINNESIKNNKYTYIDEQTLKDNKTWVFSLERGVNQPFLFVFLKWIPGKPEPIIQIVLASDDLISEESTKQYKLLNSTNLINTDLVQVVNQQNLLYVYGQTYPIKTKVVTNTGIVDFKWTIDKLDVEDQQCKYIRLVFSGEGGDYINTVITILKKAVKNSIGAQSAFELAKLNIDLAEAAENRKNRAIELEETRKQSDINIRNQKDDLYWDQTTGLNFAYAGLVSNVVASGASIVGGMLAGPAGAGAAAIMGGIQSAGGIVGGIGSIVNQHHQLDVRSRNLDQAETAIATNLAHQKNKLESAHKFEEQNERLKLYEMSNVWYNATPNNANIIEAVQKKETNDKDIAILHKVPTGRFLDMLKRFHKNFGFDIVAYDFELSASDINIDETQIYQFSRIDEINIDDPRTKEAIKNNFLNNVYLTYYKYEIKHVSYLKRKLEHEGKIAAAQAELKRIEDAKERAKLAEIEAAAKGVKEAELNQGELIKKAAEIEKENKALLTEIEQCKVQLESMEDRIAIYDEQHEEEVKKLLEIEKENIKTIAAEEAAKQCEAKETAYLAKITALETENKKCEKLRKSYDTLVDAHNAKTKEYDAVNKELQTKQSLVTSQLELIRSISAQRDEFGEQLEEEGKKYDALEEKLKELEKKEKECETHVKSPEEQAREYKVEREQKLKGYVHRVCELIKLCDVQWANIFKEINDKYTYIYRKVDGKIFYGHANTFTYKQDHIPRWNDGSGSTYSFTSIVLDILDPQAFYTFHGYLLQYNASLNINVNAFQKSYFGFTCVIGNHGNYGIFSNTKPGKFLCWIMLIICYTKEIEELALKIDQFFKSDAEIANNLYPSINTNSGYINIFRKTNVNVNTNSLDFV